MNNNPSANKAAESKNAADSTEKKVETVDYRSSAGQVQEQRPVQVVHQPHPTPAKSSTSGGLLENAAASVASTLQSAKQAISE